MADEVTAGGEDAGVGPLPTWDHQRLSYLSAVQV